MCTELYLTGYNLVAPVEAEAYGGPSFQAVQKIAQSSNVSILFTWPEAANSSIYDSAALIFRDGTVLAHYRKVNLAAGENEFFTPGSSFAPVVELDGLRVGILICFDVYLPGSFDRPVGLATFPAVVGVVQSPHVSSRCHKRS